MMRILLVGDSGRLGASLRAALLARDHEVVGASRSHAEHYVDIGDPATIDQLFQDVGRIDAVACAAGHVVYRSIDEIVYDDYASSLREKALGQIELVRRGLSSVSARGSFTLITGILSRTPLATASAAAMANGAVEAFVRAAALEISPMRINVVSPTVFVEGLDGPGARFAGFEPMSIRRVVQTYVRSIEQAETGRVYELD